MHKCLFVDLTLIYTGNGIAFLYYYTNWKKFSMSAFVHSSEFNWGDLIYLIVKIVAFSDMPSKMQAVDCLLSGVTFHLHEP